MNPPVLDPPEPLAAPEDGDDDINNNDNGPLNNAQGGRQNHNGPDLNGDQQNAGNGAIQEIYGKT